MTLLDNKKELNYYLEKYNLCNSNSSSLINKIKHNVKFIEIIDKTQNIFSKGV